MKTQIYAILDRVANDYIGAIQAHKHDATAIRTFSDIALQQDTIIAKHPTDFELVCLGYIDDDNQLIAEQRVVITGEQWSAAQQPQLVKEA